MQATEHQIHRAVATGYSKNTATYQSGRPSYPQAIVGWLSESLALTTGKTVLDLSAGTGKFIPTLLTTGATVLAAEPVEAMRAQIVKNFPEVNALAGSAENIPLPDNTLDALVCAQAFHWFANSQALSEIHRVLKPGGKLGLIWNVRDETRGWVAALTDIMTPFEADTPRYHSGAWRKLFPAHGFSALAEHTFSHTHTGTPEQTIVNRVLSVSFIASQSETVRAQITADIETLIHETPELNGQKSVTFPYTTTAYCCTKLSKAT